MTPDISTLLFKFLEGTISSEEQTQLIAWKEQNEDNQQFFDQISDEATLARMLQEDHPDKLKQIEISIFNKIQSQISFKVIPFYKRSFFRIAAAACLVLALGIGGYFILAPSNSPKGGAPVVKTTDVEAPKSNKAMITLADGKVISLDSLTTYSQGQVKVTKTADGKIIYTGFGSEVRFNTLTNPRGSKVIDMTLADGSHVWLNAGSSITYPVTFAGNERKVTMDGEAYFEASPSPSEGGGKRKFIVESKGMSVEVLGTHFNVKAYDDDNDIKVTLLEGSVKVFNDQQSLTIKPNQQAVVTGNEVALNTNPNVEEVMAWKNGKFLFSNSSMESIMKEVSRWYDVEVKFEGKIPGPFGGGLSRDNPISKLLQIMEASDRVHFEVNGKTVTVKP